MISRKHKTIFIHIEKTGGTSIENKLGLFKTLKRGVQDHKKLVYYEHIANQAYNLEALKYALYCLRKGKKDKSVFYLTNMVLPVLSPKEYKSFYKFTFVRNTWDRIGSYYINIMKDPLLKNIYGLSDEFSLQEFIEYFLNPQDFGQLSYITNKKGEIPMDFIGRFENLNSDFKIVAKELGLVSDKLPHLLKRKETVPRKELFDSKVKDLVYSQYKKEIDYFGFEF